MHVHSFHRVCVCVCEAAHVHVKKGNLTLCVAQQLLLYIMTVTAGALQHQYR